MSLPLASPGAAQAEVLLDADRLERQRRYRLLATLAALGLLLGALGLAAGPSGLSWHEFMTDLQGDQAALILGQIRAPRTLGAWLAGALLGLAGAVAQGLFRNPLADPYLLGSASGASRWSSCWRCARWAASRGLASAAVVRAPRA